MRTLQELYQEIIQSDELRQAFAEAAKSEEDVLAFAKTNGVETTLEEINAFMQKQIQADDERLSLDELENAAGGGCNFQTGLETTVSVLATGRGCGAVYAVSLASEKLKVANAHTGQIQKDDGRLCNSVLPMKGFHSDKQKH